MSDIAAVYSQYTIWAVEVSFGDNGTELIAKPTDQYNNTAVFITNNHPYTQVCFSKVSAICSAGLVGCIHDMCLAAMC